MPKVRLYLDVPEYRMVGFNLWATTNPVGHVAPNSKRVAFDVDLPPEVWKSHDISAPVGPASVVESPEEDETP